MLWLLLALPARALGPDEESEPSPVTTPTAPPGEAAPPPEGTAAVPTAPPPEGTAAVPTPPPTPGVGLRLSSDEAYTVLDAAGRRYSTLPFARLVGDEATLKSVETGRDRARIGTAALAATGAAVMLGGLLIVTSTDGAPEYSSYEPDPALYSTQKEYSAAVDFGLEQHAKATTAWNEQKVATALFLAGSGGIMLGVAPFFGRQWHEKQEHVHRAYSRDEAQGLIDKYNAAHPEPEPTVSPLVGPGMVGVTGSF